MMMLPTRRLDTLGLPPTADNEPALALRTEESREGYRSRLEQIMAKYENMADARSDVIDLRADKLVIDNGHLRSLQRDRKAVEASLFLGDFVNENGHYDEDSEDELATVQPVSATKPKKKSEERAAKNAQTPCKSTPKTAEVDRTMDKKTPASKAPVVAQTPITATPKPALPQAVATPVPGDQTTLLHALYQHTLAMSQVLQQVLPHATPDLQRTAALLNTPMAASPFTLALPSSTVAPAPSGPWSYPEFEDITPQPDPTDQLKILQAEKKDTTEPSRKRKRKHLTLNSNRTTRRKVISGPEEQVQASHAAQSGAQSATPKSRKDAAQPPADRIPTEDRSSSIAQPETMASSPSRKQQLPTPQSPVHSETSNASSNALEIQQSDAETAIPSTPAIEEPNFPSSIDDGSSHEVCGEEEVVSNLSLSPGHVILPSIEISPRPQLKPQRSRVEVRIPRIPVKPQPPREEDIQAMLAVTAQKEQRVIRSSTESDSDDLDLVPTGEPSENKAQAKSPPSLVSADAEESSALVSPRIKREPLSPRPTTLLQIPLHTPKSAPNPTAVSSSTARSTPKLSRYEFAKRARAQWARAGSKAPQSLKPQKSLPEIRKQRWAADDDSDDELA